MLEKLQDAYDQAVFENDEGAIAILALLIRSKGGVVRDSGNQPPPNNPGE